MDSEVPVQKPKYFTDYLESQNDSCWKLAVFEYFDQITYTMLWSILLPVSQVLNQCKVWKYELEPKVKSDYKLPNYCNIKIKWYQNVNEDVSDESIRKLSPTILADSMGFVVGAADYLNCTLPLAGTLKYFRTLWNH